MKFTSHSSSVAVARPSVKRCATGTPPFFCSGMVNVVLAVTGASGLSRLTHLAMYSDCRPARTSSLRDSGRRMNIRSARMRGNHAADEEHRPPAVRRNKPGLRRSLRLRRRR